MSGTSRAMRVIIEAWLTKSSWFAKPLRRQLSHGMIDAQIRQAETRGRRAGAGHVWPISGDQDETDAQMACGFVATARWAETPS